MRPRHCLFFFFFPPGPSAPSSGWRERLDTSVLSRRGSASAGLARPLDNGVGLSLRFSSSSLGLARPLGNGAKLSLVSRLCCAMPLGDDAVLSVRGGLGDFAIGVCASGGSTIE